MRRSPIDALWQPPTPIGLADFHRLIAQDARDLMRRAVDEQHKLTPPDAIHLATARRLPADVIETYDLAAWKVWEPAVGITIQEPTTTAMPLNI
jgi:hypothetical protein